MGWLIGLGLLAHAASPPTVRDHGWFLAEDYARLQATQGPSAGALRRVFLQDHGTLDDPRVHAVEEAGRRSSSHTLPPMPAPDRPIGPLRDGAGASVWDVYGRPFDPAQIRDHARSGACRGRLARHRAAATASTGTALLLPTSLGIATLHGILGEPLSPTAAAVIVPSGLVGIFGLGPTLTWRARSHRRLIRCVGVR